MKNVLIIGGTSGLGAALARQLHAAGHAVRVTGSDHQKAEDASFGNEIPFSRLQLDYGQTSLRTILGVIDEMLASISGRIDLLVYAAGYYQEGRIDALAPAEIEMMANVGLIAPSLIISKVMQRQEKLPELCLITSTSAWTPREYEPVYAAVKAGLAHLGRSLALDPRIRKTLVAGPAGMNTPFWSQTDRTDTNLMLDPAWVAEAIISLLKGMGDEDRFTYARILRDEPRVEIEEVLKHVD